MIITIDYIFWSIWILGAGGLALKSYQLIREHYEKKRVAQILDQIQNQPVFADQIRVTGGREISYCG